MRSFLRSVPSMLVTSGLIAGLLTAVAYHTGVSPFAASMLRFSAYRIAALESDSVQGCDNLLALEEQMETAIEKLYDVYDGLEARIDGSKGQRRVQLQDERAKLGKLLDHAEDKITDIAIRADAACAVEQ